MKKVKWFQQTLIVVLIAMNVFYYCSKNGFQLLHIAINTLMSVVITFILITILNQSQRKQASEIKKGKL